MARREGELKDLMNKFVCVRLVQVWGMDLQLFDFDFNLTFSVFFMNADKTIYGRYGSLSAGQGEKETAQVNMNDTSRRGFAQTLKAVLALHEKYQGDDENQLKKFLDMKKPQGKRLWKTPIELPALKKIYRKNDVTFAGCIHCHNVSSGRVKSLWMAGKTLPDKLFWAFPMPDLLGVHFDVQQVATVEKVKKNSLADKAGLKVGDRVTHVNRQPIVSVADIQWVLQHAPDEKDLNFSLQRSGKKISVALTLPKDWRKQSKHMVASLTDLIPAFPVKELGESEVGLFEVVIPDWWGAAGQNHISADKKFQIEKDGLRNGDVILEIDGRNDINTRVDYIVYFWQNKKSGEKLKLKILRGKVEKEIFISIP